MAPPLAALVDVLPCRACRSEHVTIAREQHVVHLLGPADRLAHEVEALRVAAHCRSCGAPIYERVERVGQVDEYRAAPAARPQPEAKPKERFALLEIDD
jgi:hypothetical protein